jgi:hypothetical protein
MPVLSHLHQLFNAEQCQAYIHTLRWKDPHSIELRGGRAKVSPKPWNWVKAHETGCCYPVGENLWFKSHLTKA